MTHDGFYLWMRAIHENYPDDVKLLALELAFRERPPTKAELAERLGKSEETIRVYLNRLRQDGLLEWESHGGPIVDGARVKSNRYRLTIPTRWPWESGRTTPDYYPRPDPFRSASDPLQQRE